MMNESIKESTIEIKQLQDYLIDNWLLVFKETSERGNKELQVAIGEKNLRVIVNGKTIYIGIGEWIVTEKNPTIFINLVSDY